MKSYRNTVKRVKRRRISRGKRVRRMSTTLRQHMSDILDNIYESNQLLKFLQRESEGNNGRT